MMPAPSAALASATSTTTPRSLLFKLAIKAETRNSSYRRTYFKHWIGANPDNQDTRAEALIAESKVAPRYTSSRHCAVATAKWYSFYHVVGQQSQALYPRSWLLRLPGGCHR